MPRNTGEQPELEAVDIRYRNGVVDRGITPAARRWSLDDPAYPPSYVWDIEWWQPPKP